MPLSRLMLSATLLAAMSAAVAAKPVTLSAETNLRKAPGTKSEAIGLMAKGTEVEVGECDSGWCKVTWDGQEGYAIARNLGMVVPGAPREAGVPRPAQQPADVSRLRRGYEQYFDNDSQAADQNADPRQRQYTERQYGERQYGERQYTERRVGPRAYEDDGVVYGAPPQGYVAVAPRAYYYAGPPVYYGPRVYYGYGPGPYYYRRW
jgi:uncharacterized protein YgiM (DUF1202 family)